MRSTEIKGLAVFNIANGSEIGKVSDLLINAEKKSIQYLVVDIPNWYFGYHLIPFDLVEGIGKDAVMIKSEGIMKKLSDEPAGISLIENGVKLIGSKVLTKKGQFIGKISEFFVDENDGQIIGCELMDNNNTQGIIPTNLTLTFGKDILIVDEKVETHLLDNIDDYKSEFNEITPLVEKTIPPIEIKQDISPNVESESDPVISEKIAGKSTDKPKAVQLYAQKQREYLLGKVVNNDISNVDGIIIIKKGETITEEVLDKAIVAGKLKELLIHV